MYADLLNDITMQCSRSVRFFGDAILKAKQRPIKCCKIFLLFLGQIFGCPPQKMRPFIGFQG